MTPRLELKELVPGKGTVKNASFELAADNANPALGGMAGSLGLNKRFEQAVKDLVGEDQYFTLRKTKGFQQATQQFDRSVKTAFRGDPEEDYYINFPMANLADDEDNNLISNCWNMTGFVTCMNRRICQGLLTLDRDDVKAIFDPLISDIERLVEEQVNLVTLKRMSEGHPKADQIKVCNTPLMKDNHSYPVPGNFSCRRVRIERVSKAPSRGRTCRHSDYSAT